MTKKLYVVLFTILITFVNISQLSGQDKTNIANSVFKNSAILNNPLTKSPSNIRIKDGDKIPLKTFFSEYKKTFGLSDDNEIRPYKASTDKLGQTHHRYKQYYKGVELAEVQLILNEKNGLVFQTTGNLVHNLNLNVTPSLPESVALKYALASINAESYMWQNKKNEAFIKKEQNNPNATMYPKGVLMLSARNFKLAPENFHLVYRFDIYAEKPMNRYYVDVDANTGEIINKISRMSYGDVQGQGNSVYNGVVSLVVADTAIESVKESHWHIDSWNAYDGESWWVADPSLGKQGGYSNGWYESIDTDPISLTGTNIILQFYHRYSVEDPAGASSPYNGWDGMNVRISTDDGGTWEVLQNPVPAYSNSSLYSFGEQHGEGPGIPGWTGSLNTWTSVSVDLSSYAGQTVKIRFAFASDPGYATDDGGPDLFGWQIDNIQVTSSSGTLYSNIGDTSNVTTRNLAKEATFIAGNYRLRQYGRGGGIATYDAKNQTAYPLSVDFVDADSIFDSNNSMAGVSVQWALEKTYDYYLNAFGRNSFDDNGAKIIAYAHYDDNFFNAYWDGNILAFGDGTDNSTPLVTIDIVGHELTHAVTEYTANLIGLNEPGALNESFSDILGTAAEFYTLGAGASWYQGEGAVTTRSMADPNEFGDPDTYFGQYWYTGTGDNGGIHFNCGVQNFWFYLLSEGGTGVNDLGYSYSVTGLGIDQAAGIAYRNLTNYLVPTSGYFDVRYGSILSAIDLYGDNSPQLESVIEAWNAVGVLKPALVPTVGIDSDTLHLMAEASAATDTLEVTISNYGLSVLAVTDIKITGSDFQLLNKPGFPDSLDYNEGIIIKIVFTPTQEGIQTGNLSVTSNDPANPTKTIIVQGNGYIIAPAFDKVMYASSGLQNYGNTLYLNKQTGTGTNIGLSSYTDIQGLSINPVNKQLYGIRSDDISSEIHKIDVITGNSFPVLSLDLPGIITIAFDNSGALYGALGTGEIYSIDVINGSYNLISTSKIEILAMTFDPVTNELWGTIQSEFGKSKDKIYKIDVNTGDTTFVGQTGFNVTTNDLAFDENGTLYGIKGTGSQVCDLFTIDVSTGVGTIVGSTGLRALTGLAYAETGIVGVNPERNINGLPDNFALLQNYPNPFNPSTKIRFQIAETVLVSLKVYDILGKEVKTLVNEELQPGIYNTEFDASALASGIYFYKLKAGSFVETKKMLLIK